MPPHVIARNSGVHRTAAIALYRALLSQCQLLPTPQITRNEARNIIRNRFRQVTHLGSARRLKVAFQAGYEAIDKLDAAVAGSEQSKSYILDLVARAPERIKQPWTALRSLPANSTASSLPDHEHRKPKVEFHDRPLPLEKLSGKRRIPHLVNANHVPILRFKKPQPESLTGYISKQVKRRQKRHNRRHELEGAMELAQLEDEWEGVVGKRLVQEEGGRRSGIGEESFVTPIRQAVRDTQRALDAERTKNRVWAERLQGVVDRERAQLGEDLVRLRREGRDRRYLRWCRRRGREPSARGTALGGGVKRDWMASETPR